MAARLSDEERAARESAKAARVKAREENKVARNNRTSDDQKTSGEMALQHARISRPTSTRAEPEEIKTENIDRRQIRYSGPSLPPPFSQHRGVEEVLMQTRRAAKKTYTDASELAGVRGVLNHAASNLEDAGNHHATGNHSAAHSSLTVAVGSLNHAINRVDKANGGGATTVHLSNSLQNHLNSYRDQYL
jgi:hypothetical protein